MESSNTTVGIRELRENLSAHLARVRRGQSVTITERGRVIAEIIPAQPDPMTLYEQWIADGTIIPASRSWDERPPPIGPMSTRGTDILQELREDSV
jgi:prevent-host-death family protein